MLICRTNRSVGGDICTIYSQRDFTLVEGFKNSSYLTVTLLGPELGDAVKSIKVSFNKAYNCKDDVSIQAADPEHVSSDSRLPIMA